MRSMNSPSQHQDRPALAEEEVKGKAGMDEEEKGENAKKKEDAEEEEEEEEGRRWWLRWRRRNGPVRTPRVVGCTGWGSPTMTPAPSSSSDW
jgi:hypothetical protein